MNLLAAYAFSFLGTFYKFGGNNKLEGLDCSGLVVELLKSTGEPLPYADMSAQMLFDHFSQNGEYNRYQIGALAFYGKSATEITHVGMLLDPYRMIEAGRGDRLTLTLEDARAKGAVVRIRPVKRRKDLVAVIRPKYATINQI